MPEYEKLIYEDMTKYLQLKVVVSNFKDVDYLHIRKYCLNYENNWIASREGVSIPITIDNVIRLTDAMLELCSTAEGTELLKKHFTNKLLDTEVLLCDYCKVPTEDPWHGSNSTSKHVHACEECFSNFKNSNLSLFPEFDIINA